MAHAYHFLGIITGTEGLPVISKIIISAPMYLYMKNFPGAVNLYKYRYWKTFFGDFKKLDVVPKIIMKR